MAADVVLFFDEGNRAQKDALVEIGAALDAGKHVFAVSATDYNFLHHPRVRNFDTLEQSVAALVAGQAGERMRNRGWPA